MKIAHFSDLHIGYSHLNKKAKDGRNQRLVDFEKSAIVLGQKAAQEEVDVAVVAGDFFHRINMYPSALSGGVKFADIFKEKNIPLLVIGGNHDEGEVPGQYNGLRFLEDQEKINLFLDQGQFDFKNLRFHLLGYRTLSRAEKGVGSLSEFDFSDERKNILVAHGCFGENENTVFSDVFVPDSVTKDPRFDLVLLGHIHDLGPVSDNAFFAGSVERRNFGESKTRPGFYIHNLDGDSLESRPIYLDEVSDNLPRPMIDYHFNLDDISVDSLNERVIEIIEESDPGSMIRIVLDNVPSSLDRKQYRYKWESLARKNDCMSFEVSIHSQKMSQLMDIQFSAPPTDIAAGLVEYVKGQEIENKNEVLSLTKEVISEATEKILQTEEDE